MPRLSDAMAKAVGSADAIQERGFTLLPKGRYVAKLEEVVAKQDRNNNPGWNTVWSELTDANGRVWPGKQFLWLNLPQRKPKGLSAEEADKFDKAERRRRGQLHGFFDALGFETNSDTEEMLGEKAVLMVDIEIARGGKNEGKETNTVTGIYSKDVAGDAAEVFAGDDEGDEGDGDEDDDTF